MVRGGGGGACPVINTTTPATNISWLHKLVQVLVGSALHSNGWLAKNQSKPTSRWRHAVYQSVQKLMQTRQIPAPAIVGVSQYTNTQLKFLHARLPLQAQMELLKEIWETEEELLATFQRETVRNSPPAPRSQGPSAPSSSAGPPPLPL